MFNNTFKYSVLAAALSALLTACGGSNNYNNGTQTPFQPKTVSGTAVDFYLADATVQFDNCKDANGLPVFVKTDAAGKFTFKTTETCQSSAITVTGGTDIGTGLPFTGALKLKSTNLQSLNSNSTVVSPLTTLQSYLGSSSNADIKPILEKLGLSPEIINKLEAAGFDLAQYDPVRDDAPARDMAIIFAVQQLANQVEDNLQALNKSDGTYPISREKATEIAFSSIISQTAANTLFPTNDAIISNTALNAILTKAVSDAGTVINDPNAAIDPALASQISSNITSISNTLNGAVAGGGSAQNLQTTIQTDQSIKDAIKNNLKTPVYSGFSLAGKSITELKGSSSATPLPINLAGISNALTVDFKLDNTSVQLKDTVKLAFSLAVQRGALPQETLDVSISNIALNYSSSGAISSAVIPAGTKISIASTVSGVSQSSITLTSDVNIAANGNAISLQNLIDSNDVIKTNYNIYAKKLAANDTVRVTAFVLPMTYVVDASLGLTTAAANIGGDSFIGNTLTAYFKLN
ncbi:MAG: hypothetical protein WB445_10750 [Acinetobacter sp.]